MTDRNETELKVTGSEVVGIVLTGVLLGAAFRIGGKLVDGTGKAVNAIAGKVKRGGLSGEA